MSRLRRLLPLLATVTVVVVLATVVWRGVAMSGDVREVGWPVRPWLLGLGFASYALALLISALLWRDIVMRLDGARPPLGASLATFLASWPGRYVPSSVPYVAGKIVLGARLGHSAGALGASVVYENVLMVAVALIASSVILPIALVGEGGSTLVYAGSALGGLAGLALLSPPCFRRAINLAARLARKEVVREYVLSYRGIGSALAYTSLLTLAYAVSFTLILNAFVDLGARDAFISGAALALAGGVGVAALPVPSGLGVREAVLIGVMQAVVPIESAVAAALLMRFGGLIVDLAFGAISAGVLALRGDAVDPAPRLLDAA